MHAEVPPTRRRSAARLLVMALALSGVALLIWSKLRLVTGLPRTAYAEPRAKAPPAPGDAPEPEPPRAARAAATDESRDDPAHR